MRPDTPPHVEKRPSFFTECQDPMALFACEEPEVQECAGSYN